MKLSRNWLERYLKVPFTNDELSEMLTTIGLEVEGTEEVESIKGGLNGVVVGHILTCQKHPDADKLSVTTVDVGGDEILNIVCGAPNVAAGQKVLVATVGTTLYTDEGSFKIKKSKIRGSESEGMICAEDELGLGESHDGIMILDTNAEIGMPAADLFDMTTDTVFDIGLTPNRSDATSQFGVAKDLNAYIRVNQKETVDIKEPNSAGFHINNTADKFYVEVLNQKACPRYTGLVINNVTIGPSPDWMKKLLVSVGVKPINNIVDVTNFILHELGQPLHAFDADKIPDSKIFIKNLPAGSKFVTLDDKIIELKADDIMICDKDNNGMCIGGVFGGKESGVTSDTKKIFLESAYFDAGTIRKTSMGHDFRTDAAKVYEKGADPNICLLALKRATTLICELTGGVVSSEIIDIYPKEIKPLEVRVRYEKVNEIIGHTLEQSDIHDILNALDMEISPVDQDSIKVKVPTNKFDVTREIDIIEEILRIYGFNKVPIPSVVKSNINYTEHPNKGEIKNIVATRLAAVGYNEMMGLSLMQSKECKEWIGVEEDSLVLINNTSNVHLDAMRPDMLISGLQSVLHNNNRQQSDIKLFEFGKTYRKNGDKFIEEEFLTIFITGDEHTQSWNQAAMKSNFYSIKKSVHYMMDSLGIGGYQAKELDDSRFSYGLEYHRGPLSIVKFGEISPRLLKKVGLKQKVFYAEIPIESLITCSKNVSTSVQEISKFPQVIRDLALILDKDITFDQVELIAKKTVKSNLVDMRLFDLYESEEHIGKDKKSYAVSFTFENKEKTLEEKDIEGWMSKLMNQYENRLKAQIRK